MQVVASHRVCVMSNKLDWSNCSCQVAIIIFEPFTKLFLHPTFNREGCLVIPTCCGVYPDTPCHSNLLWGLPWHTLSFQPVVAFTLTHLVIPTCCEVYPDTPCHSNLLWRLPWHTLSFQPVVAFTLTHLVIPTCCGVYPDTPSFQHVDLCTFRRGRALNWKSVCVVQLC